MTAVLNNALPPVGATKIIRKIRQRDLGKALRVRRAVDVYQGRVAPKRLTIDLVAISHKVSVAAIRRELARRRNGSGNSHFRGNGLAQAWHKAGPTERLNLIKQIGPENVLDLAVMAEDRP
jgi:hypothetical protein